MIRELICTHPGMRLSVVSVGRVMPTLGLTPQRLLQCAYLQNPVLVEKWRVEDYPSTHKQAKKDKALIFFTGKSGIGSIYLKSHTWTQLGKTPVVGANGASFSRNMLSAMIAQALCRS